MKEGEKMDMDNQKFNERTEDILVWMSENDIGALAPMIQGQITYGRGLTDEKAIGKIWNAIREMLGTLPESPIKRGKQSTLPTAVSVLIDSLANDALSAHLTLINTGNMNLLLCRLGKKANGLWDDAEYGDAMANRVKQSLIKRYNLGIWDGTREGLSSQDFSAIVEDSEEE